VGQEIVHVPEAVGDTGVTCDLRGSQPAMLVYYTIKAVL
jgi:hypothetical protein